NPRAVSRDPPTHIAPSGLLTIAGGKWTTYRHMAEDCVDHAATLARLPEKPGVNGNLNVHGFPRPAHHFGPRSVSAPPAAPPPRAAFLGGRGGWGSPVRDGARRRGRAGATHARPLPQRAGGH